MSRERYYLEDRLKVPFSGSLKYLSEAVESPTSDVIEEGDVGVDEAEQLRLRGAKFPLEVQESHGRTAFITEKQIFNQRGETVGFDTQIFPYETGEGVK